MIRQMMPPTQWFPELLRLESHAERRALWNEAQRPLSTNPTCWLIAFGCMAGGFAIVFLLANPIGQWSVMRRDWVIFWGSVIAFLVASYLMLWFVRERIRRNLRQGLIKRGHQLCVDCGYDLSGNVCGRCTECGSELRARE